MSADLQATVGELMASDASLAGRPLPGRMARVGLIAFLLLKLGLVGLTMVTPDGGVLVDSEDYLALADHFRQTGQYDDPQGWGRDFTRPPGYPLLLAGLRQLLGPSTWPIVLAQLVISGATALLLLWIGSELVDPSVGLVAGWAFALSPNTTLWSLTLMTETLFTALIVGTLAAWIRTRERHPALSAGLVGLGAGLSAYVRPIGLVLLPVWALLLGWYTLRSRRGQILVGGILVFVLVALAIVTPWHLRNQAKHGELAMTNVGSETWLAFNLAEVVAQATGLPRSEAVDLVPEERGLLPATLQMMQRYPRAFFEVQALGVARTVAGTDIGTWGNVLGWDTWRGLGLLSGLFGREIDYGTGPLSTGGQVLETWLHRGLLAYSLLYTLVLSCLLLVGLIRGLRSERFPEMWVLLALAASVILVPAASGQARFRVPAEPLLAILGAVGIVGLGRSRAAAHSRAGSEIDSRPGPSAAGTASETAVGGPSLAEEGD